LTSKIILISDITDFDVIPKSIINNDNTKIFSFNLDVHKKLELEKIEHDLADNILNKNERLQIFDKGLEFLSWYSCLTSKDLDLEGVNLLKILDGHEFHSLLIPILIKFITIKKIIDKEKPTEIICSSLLSKMIKSLIKNMDIETQFFQNNLQTNLLWDNISIKYNFGNIPISLNLSKNNFLKIKKYAESFIGFFSNFWLDRKNCRQSIVLLEFNTALFSKLLLSLKNYPGNIILVNQRRSAIWNKKAINAVKKSNSKILNFDKILTTSEKSRIPILVEEYSKKLDNFWKNSEFLEILFQIENSSFWNVIQDIIIKSYNEKLPNFIFSILATKSLFLNMDVRCIVSLNETGETEKIFLESNKNKIPFILLEHGFIENDVEHARFHQDVYVDFSDKTAVWGNLKKKYLIDEFNIDPSRILISGSPRHDDYFESIQETIQKKEITVLLAPNPITEISGFINTELELRFENIITRLISILKQFKNIKPIVKLHASQLPHNVKIKSLIKKIDPNITIIQSFSIIETINDSDIVIVITPESFGTSTILLESMILRKPIMNIVLDDQIPQTNHVIGKAVLTISDNQDLEKNIRKILFDEKFQHDLKQNADKFITKFLGFRGNASEEFAKILKSY
jgi:hypothetical protein